MRALAVIAVLAALGCTAEVDCGTIAVPALKLKLTDDVSGAAVCDAKVVIRAETHDLTEEVSAGPDCIYSGAHQHTGSFSITVSAPGYITTAVEHIDVINDAFNCHPVTRALALELMPL